MRAGRWAWWVGVAILLVGLSSGLNVTVYRKHRGVCEGFLGDLKANSVVYCAFACSSNSLCGGFHHYRKGRCSLYETLAPPTDSSGLFCHGPARAMGGRQRSTQGPRRTTPAPTAPPSGSNVPAPATIDLNGLNPLQVTLLQKCATNGGIAGIYQEANIFYFLCRRSPNDIPLNTADPGSPCSGDEISCLTTTCDADKIFIGYDQNGPKGPCYTISSTQATVDKTDCYDETSAAPLPAGKGGSWTQWRVCRTDAFFVVVGAQVSSGDIVRITCCRAKAV
ncbi:uncharacterized protein [Penaeus vannamei]|uniref:uncharacterized protein n=1 Tax=Penaeus vannamei TaxID=6689 RepID=UPI00387F7FD2